MGRRATNNPRPVPSQNCGCQVCTDKFQPGKKATTRDHTGSWQARYTDPGGKERAQNFPTKSAALDFLAEVRTSKRQGTYIDPERSRIQLWRWHGMWWKAQTGEEATLDRDERMWRIHIQPYLGAWKLIEIGHLDVQSWVNDRSKDGNEPSTVTKAFQVLDRMLGAAVRDRRLPFNPAEGVKLPRIRKKHPEDRRPPSYAQMWRIRACLPDYMHDLQILAQETGLRWGELAGLRRGWVDLEGRRIQVREVLTEVRGRLKRKAYPKSEAGLRTVPLSGLAVAVLRQHFIDYPSEESLSPLEAGLMEEELVFYGRNGGALRRSAFRRLWIKAITDAGVARVTVKQVVRTVVADDGTVRRVPSERKDYWPDFHDQRHALASRWHDRGVPEVLVQELLGHERAGEVTWLYTHAAQDVAGQLLAAMTDWRHGGRRHLRAVA